MSNRYLWRSIVIASALAACASVFAADVTGRIKGTVTDPAGAVVANATVTATNQATDVKTTTTSQSDGGYAFQALPVGTYTITVTAPGFKSFSAAGIVLNIDQEFVEPVKLDVGSASEVVSVVADNVQVNTTDMQLGNIVDSTQMVELPLIGRSFTGLELTLPGVQVSSDRFTGNYSVSGAQTQQSEYLINGADTNDISLNTIAFTPNLDAIDQFNLITGPLNAEYDRNSGGVVSATIKSGSNHFHGDAFEFYRDTFLNTLSYFQKSVATGAGTVTPYHQNIFGGTVGGPILKDKLFFFGAYQGTRQRVPQTGGNVQVYSPENLGGDFSEDLTGAKQGITFSSNPIPGTISIPGCTTGEAWSDCLTAKGGVVPTTAFNPIAAKLTSTYVPHPNSGTYGYVFNPITSTTTDQAIIRGDYSMSQKNQLMFLTLYQKSTSADTLPFTGATLPGFGDQNVTVVRQYTVDYVRQLSSTAVNDFAVHWTRFNYQAVIPQNIVDPSSLGFDIHPQDAAAASVPTITLTGFFELGFSTNGPQPRIDQVYQADDNFSKVFGAHSLKFGYDGRRFNVSNPFFANNSGSFSFNNSSSSYTTGDPSLDFLLGVPGGYSQGSGAQIQVDAFLNYVYAQDTWKVTPNFTLSYGLGYSIDTPLRNHQYDGEGIACLVPGTTSSIFPTAPLGIAYPGDKGCYNSGQAQTKYTEFGPRFGFAWAPDLGWISDGGNKKFSVRGGFGIYYNRTEEESSLQTLETPPYGLSSGGVADFGGTAPVFANPYQDLNTGATYTNKFPFVFPTKGQTIDYSTLEPLDISTYGRDFRSPYAENFQLSVEREFPGRVVTRLSYVGSLGRHNQIDYEGNFETAAGHAACLASTDCSTTNRNVQSYVYPSHTAYGAIDPNTGSTGFVSIGTVGSGAASSYHSIQASVEKAYTHGLVFQLSYTYGHALDGGSSFENSGFGSNGARGYNQFYPSLNYGDSAFDARQHLVFSPIYVTPSRGGSPYSPTNLLLSGWEISGIVTLATGFPFDISYAGGTSRSLWCSASYNFYACPDVPEQIAPLVRKNPRLRSASTGYTSWFSPGSFAAEPLGSFGNVHRNPYHGPGTNNTNMILAKNFSLSQDGAIRLQLRMESDNVFNHTQFNNPTSTYGNSNFGLITGTATARQTQIAAKVYF